MGSSMGLSCGSQFAKYFLFAFNIVFWLVGAAILGVGIWVLVDENALKLMDIATVDGSDELVKGAAITFIIVGAIVFVTGFLGCCGAIRESACMLLVYAIIVGVVLCLQIIAGILGAVFKNDIEDSLDSSMNKTVQLLYGQPDEEAVTDAWDFMQREFECCAAFNGPSEWQTSKWAQDVTNMTVPVTCCKLKNQNKPNEEPVPIDLEKCQAAAAANATGDNDYLWTQGCSPALYDWISDHAAILIGVAFGLAVIQLIGVIIACCLQTQIKSQYQYV